MSCSTCEPSKVGDTPTLIALLIKASTNTALDVSTATVKRIYLTSPSGSTTANTATFTTDGTDGQIQIVSPQLLEPGVWRYEGFVMLANGKTFTGDETTFLVETSKYGDTL